MLFGEETDNADGNDPARRLPGKTYKEAQREQARIAGKWQNLVLVGHDLIFTDIKNALAPLRQAFGDNMIDSFLEYLTEAGRLRAGPSNVVFGSVIPGKGVFLNEQVLKDAEELSRTVRHEFGAWLGWSDEKNEVLEDIDGSKYQSALRSLNKVWQTRNAGINNLIYGSWSGLKDLQQKVLLAAFIRGRSKRQTHVHGGSLRYPEDMLPFFYGDSEQSRAARRRFYWIYSKYISGIKLRDFRFGRSDKQANILQSEADALFYSVIGSEEEYDKDPYRPSIALRSFMTFEGHRAKGYKEFGWAFLFGRILSDLDPDIDRILYRKGLLRMSRQEGVDYIEFTVNDLDQVRPAARAAEEAYRESNGRLQAVVIKGQRREHLYDVWSRGKDDDIIKSEMKGKSTHEMIAEIEKNAALQNYELFRLSEDKSRAEFAAGLEEMRWIANNSESKRLHPSSDKALRNVLVECDLPEATVCVRSLPCRKCCFVWRMRTVPLSYGSSAYHSSVMKNIFSHGYMLRYTDMPAE
jgi:hypothetical protein